mgnify:CR=1 FL=1
MCDIMQNIVRRLESLNLEQSQKTIRDIELSFESLSIESEKKCIITTQENIKQHHFQQCKENILKLYQENIRLRREIYNIRMYVKYLLECENFPENIIPHWVR